MKKFVTLFTDSYKELKSVRTITLAAMLAAMSIILGLFSITVGNYLRIGFSSIPNGICASMFGPVVGGLFAGVLDILKYFMKPTGPFFPGLTAVAVLAGVLYGCMYYKRNLTFSRVLIAKFVVMAICNVLLNTVCLSILNGTPFLVLLPIRLLKNLVLWPIDSLIFYSIARMLKVIGVMKASRIDFLS